MTLSKLNFTEDEIGTIKYVLDGWLQSENCELDDLPVRKVKRLYKKLGGVM